MNNIELKYENETAFVTISREKALNALNTETLKELGQVVSEIKDHKTTRLVYFSGAGEKAFVAGADISEMQKMNQDEALAFGKLGQSVFSAIEDLPQTTIALVNGFALGGGFELALSCDVLLSLSKAKFGLPEVGLGLIPGFGGTQRLSRSIGIHLAKAMVFSGDMLSGSDLKNRGLIYETFETKEDLFAGGKAYADKVLSKGPLAISSAKKAIQTGFNLTLDKALDLEASEFSKLFGGAEAKEGIEAFVSKRRPKFTKLQ